MLSPPVSACMHLCPHCRVVTRCDGPLWDYPGACSQFVPDAEAVRGAVPFFWHFQTDEYTLWHFCPRHYLAWLHDPRA